MASVAQIEANRVNSQLSTGPKTEQGKAISSRNHLKYGLTTRHLYIPPGGEETFHSLESGLRDQFNPQGDTEEHVFGDMTRFRFNILRCLEIEANLMTQAAGKGVDPLLDQATNATFQRINTYRRQNENGFYRSLNELRKLQTERAFRELALQPGTEDSISPAVNTAKVRSHYLREQAHHSRAQLAALDAYINAPMPVVASPSAPQPIQAVSARSGK